MNETEGCFFQPLARATRGEGPKRTVHAKHARLGLPKQTAGTVAHEKSSESSNVGVDAAPLASAAPGPLAGLDPIAGPGLTRAGRP